MLLAALLAAWAAAPAAAQIPYTPTFTTPGERLFGLALGAGMPAGGGLQQVAGRGPSIGLDFYDYLTDWAAWGLALDIHQLGSGADAGPPARSGKASFKSLSVLARVNFLRGETWTPYAVGGAGFATSDVAVSCSGAGCGTPNAYSRSKLGLAVTGGAGVEAFVSQGFSAFVEGRLQEYPLPLGSVSFPAPQGTGQALSIRVGVHLWIGPSDS